MLSVSVVGVFVSDRGRRRRTEGGGHSVLFLIDQQLLSIMEREREEEGGLCGVRQCVCSVFR